MLRLRRVRGRLAACAGLFVALALWGLAAPATTQTLADTISGCGGVPPEATINANPGNYMGLLAGLQPGQRLLLAAGTYASGLPITNLNGQPNRCIVVEGPATGPAAVFPGRDCCNTVSMNDSSYVALRNLELDGQGRLGDGVKAESGSVSVHHVLLDNLYIHGHGADQQIVGISTKTLAWNWAIRRCRIVGAGTGIYLGNSDGTQEFVNGLVERNLIVDTIGYNMQIKHQDSRNTGAGIPASATTIIRHNVFSKASGASTGGNARPNLLVGHWPLTGPGSTDVYQIYGNFFWQNPVEGLFQGTGNVAFYDNLLVNGSNPGFPAVNFQQHEGGLNRSLEVFQNTVVAPGTGIGVTGVEGGYLQRVRGNAVFAATPLNGGQQTDNITDTYAAASSYLVNPTGAVGAGLDLFPRVGMLGGAPIGLGGASVFLEWDRDFNSKTRTGNFRGGYDGEGLNPGWALALTIKPEQGFLSIGDVTQAEGNAGATSAVFGLTLAGASQTVTLAYATANGTATAGSDYVSASGSLTFPAGTTTRTIAVTVLGDRVLEGNETFFVNLANPVGATLSDGQGQGTITNDDSAGFTIDDVTVAEGRSGPVTATFAVTLAPSSGVQTSVAYATTDGSATTASGDYIATAGTLTFNPGATSLPVSVQVNPDAFVEGAQTFSVGLSNPQGGPVVAFSPGTGTILDPQGGADFDGDGKTDILFRHAVSGKNVVWYMDGITRTAGVFTNPDQLPDTNWGIVGTNDFNADGSVDILFRHGVSGKNVVWYMNGITRTAGVFTNPDSLADTNWKMVGTGDFDTSGKPDILWRHGVSGKNVIWFMDGITRIGGVFTVPDSLADTNWQMVGVGDFSSDGKPDILWRHGVSGKNVAWYMIGVFRTAGLFTSPDQLPDTNWKMVAVGDFDSNEKPDILFRHGISGKNVVWYMDGITRTGGVFTNPDQLPDTNWKIVGPK